MKNLFKRSIIYRIFRYFFKSYIIFIFRKFFPKLYTKYRFKKLFSYYPNLDNPKSFNEKINWIKLYALKNNPLIIKCVDKSTAREYVEQMNCSELLYEIYGVWDKVEDIEWEKLPHSFVLKCNHGCGFNIFCKDKNSFNIEMAKKKLTKWMKNDFSILNNEYQYQLITRKIICEEFLQEQDEILPLDYKLHCFNGVFDFLLICKDRAKGQCKYYAFDRNWNNLIYRYSQINQENTIKEPPEFKKMIEYAELLSKPFPFVRIDFYLIKSKIYIGEFTFTPCAGFDYGIIKEIDFMLGEKININDFKNIADKNI